MSGQRGTAGAEYLSIVAAVGIMFAGLVLVRPHVVDRRTPVDVIPPIVRLLGKPVENLAPRPPRPPRPLRPPRPFRPRPRPVARPQLPPTVPLPEWWGGR